MTTAAEAEVDHLAVLRAYQRTARAAEVGVAQAILQHALARPPVDEADVALDPIPVALAGEDEEARPALNAAGVPQVSAIAVAELGVVMAVPTASARRVVSEILEIAFRLPGVWERVLDGRVPVWQARRIAARTLRLNAGAVGFVDQHLRAAVGRVGLGQVDRLVTAAIARHDPDLQTEREQQQREQQQVGRGERPCFDVDLEHVSLTGLVHVGGLLDLPDALALDAAVRHGAAEHAAAGSPDPLPARRARALGDLGREHLTGWEAPGRASSPHASWSPGTAAPDVVPPGPGQAFVRSPGRPQDGGSVTDERRGRGDRSDPPADSAPDLSASFSARDARHRHDDPPDTVADHDDCTGERLPQVRTSRRAPSRRHLVLHVHLTQDAITRCAADPRSTAGEVALARVEDPHLPVTAETVRRWCGDTGTRLTVLPVLDLHERRHHGGYEIPTRMREHVLARDLQCVFPFCATPARACDLDHVIPYDHDTPSSGGETTTDNLAPLCRRHHRLKTTGRIRYQMTSPGTYEWRFPDGTHATVDHIGTTTPAPDTDPPDADPPDVAPPPPLPHLPHEPPPPSRRARLTLPPPRSTEPGPPPF